ncbi:MAG: undecaprenyl-diphosphate phosphatase, partial [Aquificaceae bacterium]
FLPTGFLGFVFYKFIKTYLIGNDKVVVTSLVIGGIFLLSADRFCQRFCYIGDVKDLSLKRAFFIGLFQSLAMIPGVSRSASTIIGGMFLGLHRKLAAEFSFMLAIPTMLIATVYDLYKSHQSYASNDWYTLSVGFIVAFVSAIITVRTFLNFISKHSFLPFGAYRIVVGFVYALFFI